jgi:hypothetical protein
MKNIIFEVGIPENVSVYIERLFFEKEGYITLFRTIASHNKGAAFYVQLRDEFFEKEAEYKMAFEELKNTYVSKEIIEQLTPSHKIEINFASNKLSVYLEEGGSCCGV